jgi:Uri superfamily endonuclease
VGLDDIFSRRGARLTGLVGRGTYVLVMLLDEPRTVPVGRLGVCVFEPGHYLYVGSAFGPGGIAARLGHHLRRAARPHWHIDYLRQHAPIVATWQSEEPVHQEHAWADLLGSIPDVSPGPTSFGASDCRCRTHLFHMLQKPLACELEAAADRANRPIKLTVASY